MNKLGLILTGAGARGLVQPAYAKAFYDLGLKYDALYCASAGSLTGALVHAGDYDKLYETWLSIRTADVYTWNPVTISQLFNEKAALFDSTPLRKLIKKCLNYRAIVENPVPFIINTTNLGTWKPLSVKAHELSQDRLIDCLWASASPPLAFPPVEVPPDVLVDGGVINNFSIGTAVEDGMTTLVILRSVKDYHTEPKNILQMLGVMLGLPCDAYLDRELKFVNRLNSIPGFKDIRVIIIQYPDDLGLSFLDFDYKGLDRKQVLTTGYNHAKAILQRELCS